MDLVLVLAFWLHTLAFVIAWGYYGVLARIILPALTRSLDRSGQSTVLLAIERRALPLVLVSMVLFFVTGTYLLVSDPDYAGLGHVLASTWTTLMLVKHLLVIAMIGLGVAVDILIRSLAEPPSDDTLESSFRWLSRCAEGAMGLGALIALLTAAAQVAQ
jgi:uncharacterized membrane protein